MATNYLITGYHGTPHLTAENDRYLYASIFGSGRYVLSAGKRLHNSKIGTNKLRLYDGLLLINGALAGIPAGQYIDFEFPEVGSGRKRIDLIVFEYNRNVDTQIETGEFKIISGTETSEGWPPIPDVVQADILSGTATRDQTVLFQVTVTGLEGIAAVKVIENYKDIKSTADQVGLAKASTAKSEAIAEAGNMDVAAAIEAAKMVNLIPNGDFDHPANDSGADQFVGPGELFNGWTIPEGVSVAHVDFGDGASCLFTNATTEDKIVFTKLPKGSLVAGQLYTAGCQQTPGGAQRIGVVELAPGPEYTQFIAPSGFDPGMAARIGADFDEIGIVITPGENRQVYRCLFSEGDLTNYAPLQATDYYPRRDKSVDAMIRTVMELQPMVGMQPKLMWTNPDPNAEFVSSSVDMNLAGYTHVLIEAQSLTDAGVAYTEHFLISAPAEGGADPKRGCLGVFNCTGWRRTVNVYTDRVYFGSTTFYNVTAEATTQGTTDNLKLVPYRIYGIRRMYV